LRSVFAQAAQSVTPQARRLNADFREVPPPHKGGAPKGNRNALKHGTHTRERRHFFAALNAHIAEGRALLAALTLSSPASSARQRDAREGDLGADHLRRAETPGSPSPHAAFAAFGRG
jgi:hypothetical protein